MHGSSLFALLTLNVERFLALTCPFFHQASVTKTRLLCFQAFLTVIIVGLSPVLLHFNAKMFANIVVVVFFLLLLFVFIYLNYKMFKIAKSKREDERVVSTTATSMDENRKTRILNLKSISTCSLAVSCFIFSSFPQILCSALRLASALSERQFLLFNLWTIMFISVNSTLNSVIFFWRNSILRREGMKIVNAFRRRVTN
jgi:Ca2+/Na+ antiporter